MQRVLLGAFYSFFACVGFGLTFNLRGRRLALSSLGGAIGWAVYLMLDDRIDAILLNFLAMTVVAVYAEIMAVKDKCPTTVYLVVGLLPFVPGGGLYYTMKYAVIDGNIQAFINKGMNTLGISLALAVAIAVVVFGHQIIQQVRRFRQRNKRD